MEIKILGTGCQTCKTLEKLTRDTLADMNIQATVSKEEDIMNIMSYGIMRTPGLVVNGKVALSGRIPSDKELREIFSKNL